jgi:hypothetical protein
MQNFITNKIVFHLRRRDIFIERKYACISAACTGVNRNSAYKSPQGIKMMIAVAAIFNAGFQSIFFAPPDNG